ncbi:hypothetical protein PR048_021851 [Dryococelus australis]|uniref:Uncharacterized protein n=1 Tax=Dryococelus australis TaxID=614101 RepID=A0ABQ9GZC9_9NEOP|nr:hypothetical protein PR048_021851 [Dryococelus australis]
MQGAAQNLIVSRAIQVIEILLVWNSSNFDDGLRAGKTGDPRENPPTRAIIRHDSHIQKSGGDPTGNRGWFAWLGGEQSNHYTTAAPSPSRVHRPLLRAGARLCVTRFDRDCPPSPVFRYDTVTWRPPVRRTASLPPPRTNSLLFNPWDTATTPRCEGGVAVGQLASCLGEPGSTSPPPTDVRMWGSGSSPERSTVDGERGAMLALVRAHPKTATSGYPISGNLIKMPKV